MHAKHQNVPAWKRLAAAFTLSALLLVSACGQEDSITDTASLPAAQAQFRDGDAMMSCDLACSGSYGFNRIELHQLYTDKDWTGLSTKLLVIGANNDQAWFYLASAAEGLGYDDAAQTYYFSSITARFHCAELINMCDGLKLPNQTFDQLAKLDQMIAQRPEFSQPITSTAETIPAPVQIHLTSHHGLLKAPVLIDGHIPAEFAIDSGASGVNIPLGMAAMMLKTGMLQKPDVLGETIATLGDGSRIPVLIIRIHSLQIGGIIVKSVIGSVSGGPSELLLGQSFLKHFKSWSIDNAHNTLILQ